MGLLLVHAVNPYGFAHTRRVNESNVDLNRNFLRHPDEHVPNPDYDALYEHINPTELDEEADAAHVGALLEFGREHGIARLQEVLSADTPFSQALLDRNDRLRLAQTFYRRRLRSALESARALHRMSVPRMDLLVAERADALRAISDLDDHYLTQIRSIHDAFLDLWDPSLRPAIAEVRQDVAEELADLRRRFTEDCGGTDAAWERGATWLTPLVVPADSDPPGPTER